MGEPATSLRLNGAEEFDRRVRSLTQTSPHADALAELARLVDSQGPFGAFQVGAQTAPPSMPSAEPRSDATDSEVEAFGAEFDRPHGVGGETEGDVPVDRDAGYLASPLQDWERAVPRYPSLSVQDQRPIETSPDVWVQGVEDDGHDAGDAPVLTATRERPPGEGSSPKRTLIVLAAVVLLTAGGLGASVLVRPSASAVTTAVATPTIMAVSGPSKVQPETATAGDDAPSEPSKLLDKNKNDGTAEAKIISTTEEPVDLNQAIKATAPDNPASVMPPSAVPASTTGAFPEPRKVKTILVRPDGSIIPSVEPGPTDAAPQPSTDRQQANLAFDPTTMLPHAPAGNPPATTGAAQSDAATPAINPMSVAMPAAAQAGAEDVKPAGKTTARVAMIKPAASTTQDANAAAQARSTVATPKAKPVVHAKPKPKPAATPTEAAEAPAVVADAAPTAAPAAPDATPTASVETGGSFAIQLGAAPTEAEGQATASRLGQKYAADLGGATPSVRKAQAGGKTVYRIRVGNLSQAAAKALCGKVASSGGGCFVARN